MAPRPLPVLIDVARRLLLEQAMSTLARGSQLERREAAVAAEWGKLGAAVKLAHRQHRAKMDDARRQTESASALRETVVEYLASADKVLATAVARKEAATR